MPCRRMRHSNREVGGQLRLDERTIGKYGSNTLDKRRLANRTQAAPYALRKGIENLELE
jgi:DNA-binding NarL/FixJ family response regulator